MTVLSRGLGRPRELARRIFGNKGKSFVKKIAKKSVDSMGK